MSTSSAGGGTPRNWPSFWARSIRLTSCCNQEPRSRSCRSKAPRISSASSSWMMRRCRRARYSSRLLRRIAIRYPPSSTIAAARKSSGGGHATDVAGSAAPVSRAVSNDILHFPA